MMVAGSVEKGAYDFDSDDDVERFIREVIKPEYDEALKGGFKPTSLALGMPVLTGMHRLIETRDVKGIPIHNPFPPNNLNSPKEGELLLEWNGVEDCSWALL